MNILENFSENLSFAIFLSSLILLFGAILSWFFEKLTINFLNKIKLKLILSRNGWETILEKFDPVKFIGEVVKIFFVILTLVAFFEVLGLSKISDILTKIVLYYPNIFISIVIFLAILFGLDFSKKVFIGTFRGKTLSFTPIFSKTLEISVWILTGLAVLYQLQIVKELILIIFAGVVFGLALTFGLAFGSGGKEIASRILKEIEENFKK
ncbi:hypothetical protein H5T58_02040 [Candidatus Parcubacteria bacterium]|nr:hypothetical protein [Candidatus Parcubacteria bacterium]